MYVYSDIFATSARIRSISARVVGPYTYFPAGRYVKEGSEFDCIVSTLMLILVIYGSGSGEIRPFVINLAWEKKNGSDSYPQN